MKLQGPLFFCAVILIGCLGRSEEKQLISHSSIPECLSSAKSIALYDQLKALSVGIEERETKVEFSMVFRMIELNNLKIIDVSGITASKTDSLRMDIQNLRSCITSSIDSVSYDIGMRQNLKTMAGIEYPNFAFSNGSLSKFVGVLPNESFKQEEFRRMLRLIMMEIYLTEFPEDREH